MGAAQPTSMASYPTAVSEMELASLHRTAGRCNADNPKRTAGVIDNSCGQRSHVAPAHPRVPTSVWHAARAVPRGRVPAHARSTGLLEGCLSLTWELVKHCLQGNVGDDAMEQATIKE